MYGMLVPKEFKIYHKKHSIVQNHIHWNTPFGVSKVLNCFKSIQYVHVLQLKRNWTQIINAGVWYRCKFHSVWNNVTSLKLTSTNHSLKCNFFLKKYYNWRKILSMCTFHSYANSCYKMLICDNYKLFQRK